MTSDSPRPCRVCACELTPEVKAIAKGNICKRCASEQTKARPRYQARLKANSGRECSGCGGAIGGANKSGFCASCSGRTIGLQVFGSLLPKLDEPHPCPRCSIQTNYPVCRDCRDVLRDLKELHLWVDELVAA